ncbi:protein phosphatase 1 regulatory inhibitor subunit 16B [Elysia marginata]|uniref:Protein phosphatase 1 regulatory inhibitor subunit 16B n=1 Tax=Elysia marginata TaxID=1093978 RepID=A0AAV4JY34_9GAST|nr:protein phosphatase 1 regulatory inhibitor subunit 16B [Elysia marginata]
MAHNLVDAICSGDIDLAKDILIRGMYADIDSLPANRPGTALFCCCIRGYLPLGALLLERHADVDCKNETLATPLHGAVDNGHLELVK